jgi:hypothetical protein
MRRAATDHAAVAGENPSGALVWVGGADGCADVWYHHCLGKGDGTRRPAQERQAGRAAGCRAGGEGTRADGRVWEVGANGTDTARARARASTPRRRWRERKRQRERDRWRPAACMWATQCGTHAGRTIRGACKRANRQVGGRDGTGHGGKGTTRNTDTVKAWTRLQRVMPSASLVGLEFVGLAKACGGASASKRMVGCRLEAGFPLV